ncbi:hypothetical protein, partial [Paenibacillus periandrae]|uniref:hypothetical protein n=1 Tax=Paenibacillus periandrae TaxID=1761741 RepID=UPI001F099C6B
RIIRSHPRFFKMTQLYGKKGTGSSTFLKNCTFFLKMDFFSGLYILLGCCCHLKVKRQYFVPMVNSF